MQHEAFARKLGKSSRFLILSQWNGEWRIDIREWTLLPKNAYPTKKGVSLPLIRWEGLCNYQTEIEEAVRNKADLKEHIGGNVYAQVSKNFPNRVDLRQYFLPDGMVEPIPTKRGISLVYDEWEDMIACREDLQNICPQLKDLTPCFMNEDHQAQLGMLRCPECNPNQHGEW